jgi:hypothetical protein
MSIPGHFSMVIHSAFRPLLQENHWNQASAIARNESVVFKVCLPRCSAAAGTAVNPV